MNERWRAVNLVLRLPPNGDAPLGRWHDGAMADFSTVDEYIATFPADVQEILQQVRRTILGVVPEAGEKISYQIPTITMDGRALLYFSGWKQHISVYPIPAGDEALAAEIEPYRAGKGTLKFPLNKPIPYDLIARLAQAFVDSRNE